MNTFKVWSTITNRWVSECDTTHEYFLSSDGKLCRDDVHCPCGVEYLDYEQYKVAHSTGMKDIHGKIIHSGDLVKTKWEGDNFREVSWSDRHAMYVVTDSNDLRYRHYFNYLTQVCIKNWKVEIVGNIYENPELIAPPYVDPFEDDETDS